MSSCVDTKEIVFWSSFSCFTRFLFRNCPRKVAAPLIVMDQKRHHDVTTLVVKHRLGEGSFDAIVVVDGTTWDACLMVTAGDADEMEGEEQ